MPIVQVNLAPGLNLDFRSLRCYVELFRVPDEPTQSNTEFTYYAEHGSALGRDNFPVFALYRTRHPQQSNMGTVLHRIGNHLFYEQSHETHLLKGIAIAEPVTGVHNVQFVFPGLGVLQSGKYVLRYNVHDIVTGRHLASCFGAPFQVMSASNFPGMGSTTPLTNSLAPLHIPGVRRRN